MAGVGGGRDQSAGEEASEEACASLTRGMHAAGQMAGIARSVSDYVLPDAAGVVSAIGCAGLAGKRLLELGHVLHHAVHAELGGRVRIGLHLQAQRFLALVGAPDLAEATGRSAAPA